jgi:hypothetical protein
VLLRDPSFARAVDDLRDFNSIDGFQETGSDTLTVSLTDAGITAPAAPHYLRRLFDAYRGLARSDDAVMLLTHRGRLAGTYSTLGLSRRDWR